MPDTLVAILLGMKPRKMFQVKSVEKAPMPVAGNVTMR
jgi:hypothetical protein